MSLATRPDDDPSRALLGSATANSYWPPRPPTAGTPLPQSIRVQAANRVSSFLRVPQQVEACAEIMRQESDDMLTLEKAEMLFWSGGNLDKLDNFELESRTPRPEAKRPGLSSLGRCSNCNAYGMFRMTARGKECVECCFLQSVSSVRFPGLVSPRLAAEAEVERRVEQLSGEVHALHRRAYVKPRLQERPLGWKAGLPISLMPPWEAMATTPRSGVSANTATASARGASSSGAAASATKASAGAAWPISALASPRKTTSVTTPLPWLPGRADPPPQPPPPPTPPAPPPGMAAEAAVRARRPRSAWTLEKSIWWPRRKWTDSKELYDTDGCLIRAMTCDWNRAMEGGLVKHVTQSYAGGADMHANAVASVGRSEAEKKEEIQEILDALIAHARMIYSVFDFYASLGSSLDCNTIGFNAYKSFIADAELTIDRSKHCDDSHYDQMFIQVNSAGAVAAAAKARETGIKSEGARSFGRAEMMHMFARVAINRQIFDGSCTDVSQAVHELCEWCSSKVEPQALASADDFRREYCYVEAVSVVLLAQKRNLRTLFEVYADFPNIKLADQKLLSLEDWMLLLKHLHFFDEAFQQREGVLCFVQSRLRAVDEESERGKKRMKHMNFEDFLEAIVRVSTMKALPTTSELLLAGYADAGLYMVGLMANPTAYNVFVEARERHFGDPLSMPIERCVEHLLQLIIRVIESSISGGSGQDGRISKNELMRFHRFGGMKIADQTAVKKDASTGGAPSGAGALGLGSTSIFAGRGASGSVPKPVGAGGMTADVKASALKWGASPKGGGGLVESVKPAATRAPPKPAMPVEARGASDRVARTFSRGSSRGSNLTR